MATTSSIRPTLLSSNKMEFSSQASIRRQINLSATPLTTSYLTRPITTSSIARRPQPPATTTSSPSPSELAKSLPWEKYLQMRKSRRLAGLITAVPTTVVSGFAAGSYFLTQEIGDPTQTLLGIDPVYMYGLATIAATGMGYLVGPSLGTWLWSLAHRSQLQQMQIKDADFYEHIKRRRVSPVGSNMQNPIPDFYGEKISSIKEYRSWLRDCSIYRRKAAHGLQQDAPEGGV